MSAYGIDQLFSVHARKTSDLYGKFCTYVLMSKLYRDMDPRNSPSDADLSAVLYAIENYLTVLVAAKKQWKALKSQSAKAAQNPALSLAKVLADNSEAFVNAKTALRKIVSAYQEKFPNDIWFHEIESTVSDLNRESDTVVQALRDLTRPCSCACTAAPAAITEQIVEEVVTVPIGKSAVAVEEIPLAASTITTIPLEKSSSSPVTSVASATSARTLSSKRPATFAKTPGVEEAVVTETVTRPVTPASSVTSASRVTPVSQRTARLQELSRRISQAVSE